MEVLNTGMRFLFTKDYITQNRKYKKDTICNILNGVVVLGDDMEFLFDVDSNLSRKYGKITTEKQSMKNDIINLFKLVECMKDEYENESNLKMIEMTKNHLLSALGGIELLNDEE